MTLSPATSRGATAFSGAAVYLTTNLVVANAADVTWQTVEFDTDGYFSAGAPTRLTVPAGLGGRFLVGCHCDWAGSPSGNLDLLINASNRSDAVCGFTSNTVLDTNPLIALSDVWTAVAGDFLTVRHFCSTSPQTLSGSQASGFWLIRLSA